MGLDERDLQAIERETQIIGRQIFGRLRVQPPPAFSLDWWDDRILERCMHDEALKVQMFRFIDVLPALQGPEEVVRHLREYFLGDDSLLPPIARWGLHLAGAPSPAAPLIAQAVRRGVGRMAQRFVAGATPDEASAAIRRLRERRLGFTVDILGEATLSEAEAAGYQQRYLELVEGLAARAASWEPVPLVEEGPAGPIPRVNVSVKLTALYSQCDPIDPEGSGTAIKERLRPILRAARRAGAHVTVDMEHHDVKDLTLRTFQDLLLEDEFHDYPEYGIAIQAYLRGAEGDLAALAEWARSRGTPVGVRLVKGAYWDFEMAVAQQRGWPVPVFTEKSQTDASFERCLLYLLAQADHLRPAVATHNIRSLAFSLAAARHLGLPDRSVEFQVLHGMSDPIQEALAGTGQRVRVYVPYGELLPGMSYLVRRLLENTANESFLRQSFTEHVAEEELLRPPRPQPTSPPTPTAALLISPTPGPRPPVPAFRNEPDWDFGRAEVRAAMRDALKRVRRRLGRRHPVVIGGDTVTTAGEIASVNPSHPSEVVGLAGRAGIAEADQAVAAARAAWPSWGATPPADRAGVLFRAAEILRERRAELAAWEVLEAGKPWREAEADVAEAIDYCEYYAREMLRLAPFRRLADLPGEVNEYGYRPRGVAAVIAPWNFPLAILAGMTTAALVAGNAVIMKPAEQTPVVAALFHAILLEAGAPPGAVHYLPGIGEEAGARLVAHPDVDLIAFTGSRTVGLRIAEVAGETREGQRGVKKVILEMGGKNAVIVDDDADLDEAVRAVATSAFGYAGQKCSACSRAVVLEAIAGAFLSRLVEAGRSLRVGPTEVPGTFVGPLIDAEAKERVLGRIAAGRREARPVLEGDVSRLGEGYFVAPTVFADVPARSDLAQEEIFGPVLAVLVARHFDEALALANGTAYALTGGIYSRSPSRIERARREFAVGNLYINRKITGARVGLQPFGGFRMSGIGSKAGGPDYLLQFLEPQTISENTMRRGFAPSLPRQA
jgi:RHH-type proline utilization regulon transcriptional repressor/proline dehydrogenase/delta 1-pyrroline-5-carboxylate dehydrogenase